jgi:twitching motility protein PilT
MAAIDDLLRLMTERGASDLHIKVGSAPAIRIAGRLGVVTELPALTSEDTEMLARSMMDEDQNAAFDHNYEADFAYSLHEIGRFRVNVFHQRGSVGMALRRVTTERATIEELGLPPVVLTLADEPRGLVLVTGTAGSGKTTTLASMIDHINKTRDGHIITIEDPIEVLHRDVKSIVNQRELGIDTASYADALRHVVRQDPDVILIGEMRDLETVSAAITAAEIGNLVMSTLHTIDATETINRIIDFFPPYQQKQIRVMLAATLKGIISMRLLPSLKGGLVPAVEIMVMTGTIREFLMDPEQTYRIRDAIEEGDYYGVSLRDAVAMAANAHDFKIKLRSLGIDPQKAAESGIY